MSFLRSIRMRLAVGAVVALVLPCFASEVAVLKNGFSIRHERREVVGEVTRLYVSADGSSFVDVPTAEIEHFEAAPELPAPGSGARASGMERKSSLLASYAKDGAPGSSPFARNTSNSSRAFANLSPADLDEVVNSASGRYRLDPDLVSSVIKAESGFNVRAVSPKGAQGLMQLMPATASELGVPNAFDARANVEGGTRYLRELLERYNFNLVKALAAYNAGPQRVEQFGGVPPYYETQAYVARVVRDFNKKKAAQRSGTKSQTAATTTGAKAHAGKSQDTGTSGTAEAKP
jgi:hypothetical protein